MNFISISKKFPGDDGQVPYSKENDFGNEKFSKTHSKKAVLDMSKTRQVILAILPNWLLVNQESLVKVTGMYVDKIETLYTNTIHCIN